MDADRLRKKMEGLEREHGQEDVIIAIATLLGTQSSEELETIVKGETLRMWELGRDHYARYVDLTPVNTLLLGVMHGITLVRAWDELVKEGEDPFPGEEESERRDS